MPGTLYRGRRAASIENDDLRVTVLYGGGHVAEIFDKQTGVNPLWTPPWPSIEPSSYHAEKYPEYGTGSDARLLAGIMGHNLCLDLFGGPSPEEAAAGIGAHGEGAVASYEIRKTQQEVTLHALLPAAQLHFERSICLERRSVKVHEAVENLSACDRPIAWTQHVTLGPPFLEKGVTQFRASATRSKVFESVFGSAAYLKAGAEFDWPLAPRIDEGFADLRVFNSAPASSGFTTHLMNPERERAFFAAFSPTHKLAIAYVWKRSDFPWLGIWEENYSRSHSPWNGGTLARGMEFGVSPMPEARREMIERGKMFGVPTYRWVPAKSRAEVDYHVVTCAVDEIPESVEWPG